VTRAESQHTAAKGQRRRIAILWHARDRTRRLDRYVITRFADYWREGGHEVRFVFGPGQFVPADIAVLHVDLSVVPEPYLELAARYPVGINGRVRDIRHSAFSRQIVHPGDGYEGAVIVKSDLNHGGLPERTLEGPLGRAWRRLRRGFISPDSDSLRCGTPLEYRVYQHRRDAPPACFQRTDLVVERFLPEREDGLYHVRTYQFLGDRWTCARLSSPEPIVNDHTETRSEPVEPHPDIARLRHTLGFDYGKFDYVMHAGEPVLLDANKTTNVSAVVTPELEAMRRHRAMGLYSYF
jgi:hypothetical protein